MVSQWHNENESDYDDVKFNEYFLLILILKLIFINLLILILTINFFDDFQKIQKNYYQSNKAANN